MKEQLVQIPRKYIRRIAKLREKMAAKDGKYFQHEEDLWNAEIDLINECVRIAGYGSSEKDAA